MKWLIDRFFLIHLAEHDLRFVGGQLVIPAQQELIVFIRQEQQAAAQVLLGGFTQGFAKGTKLSMAKI